MHSTESSVAHGNDCVTLASSIRMKAIVQRQAFQARQELLEHFNQHQARMTDAKPKWRACRRLRTSQSARSPIVEASRVPHNKKSRELAHQPHSHACTHALTGACFLMCSTYRSRAPLPAPTATCSKIVFGARRVLVRFFSVLLPKHLDFRSKHQQTIETRLYFDILLRVTNMFCGTL